MGKHLIWAHAAVYGYHAVLHAGLFVGYRLIGNVRM